MPTAYATLLPPPFVDGTPDTQERGSGRHLEQVGVENILGAMIEQKRRASQPSFSAIDVGLGVDSERGDESDAPSERVPTTSEVFVKAR